MRRLLLAAAVFGALVSDAWAFQGNAYHDAGRYSHAGGVSIWPSFNFGLPGMGMMNYFNGPLGLYGAYGYPGYTSYMGNANYFGFPNVYTGGGLNTFGPQVTQAYPIFLGPNPFNNPVLNQWQPNFADPNAGNAVRAIPQNLPQPPPAPLKSSTVEAKRRCIRLVAQGDEWFAKQNYLQAHAHYKQAAAAAADLPQARFRLGLALCALGHFSAAVAEFKRGVQIDPAWPATGDGLEKVFGASNRIAIDQVLHSAAVWVKEDIRDSERLFVMGVLLYFNHEPERALPFFQTADMLSGETPHVQAFIKSAPLQQAVADARDDDASEPVQNAAPQPAVPQPPQAVRAPLAAAPQVVDVSRGGRATPKLFRAPAAGQMAVAPKVTEFGGTAKSRVKTLSQPGLGLTDSRGRPFRPAQDLEE